MSKLLKDMLSEGNKVSSKRVCLAVLLTIVTLSYYCEQFFNCKVSIDKFDAMITLTEVALWTVLGDKLPDIVGRFNGNKKEDVTKN